MRFFKNHHIFKNMNREIQKNFFYFYLPKRIMNKTINENQNNTFRLKLNK